MTNVQKISTDRAVVAQRLGHWTTDGKDVSSNPGPDKLLMGP